MYIFVKTVYIFAKKRYLTWNNIKQLGPIKQITYLLFHVKYDRSKDNHNQYSEISTEISSNKPLNQGLRVILYLGKTCLLLANIDM